MNFRSRLTQTIAISADSQIAVTRVLVRSCLLQPILLEALLSALVSFPYHVGLIVTHEILEMTIG